jgi:hypothetical protein
MKLKSPSSLLFRSSFLIVVVIGWQFLGIAGSKSDPRVNLALSSRGAMVLASSFLDTKENYTDHLINGDLQTGWKARDTVRPQWLEIRWPWPQKISGVRLMAEKDGRPKRWSVLWKDGPLWKEAGTAQGILSLDFPEIEASRVKVVLEEIEMGSAALSEIEILGPAQPVPDTLRPYWKASYIWHPEIDRKVHLGSPRYFRKTFSIEDPSKIQEAWLQSRSNDHYIAYLNGREVDHGSHDIHAVAVKDHLLQGKNVLAYTATAGSDPGWGNMELLGELTIHETDQTVTIGTDEKWKSATEEQPGWNEPDFEDESWSSVAVLVKPPEGPWGRIPFLVAGPSQVVEVADFSVEPENPQPGQDLEMRMQLRFSQSVSENYLFEFTLRDPEVNTDRADYRVSSFLISPDPSLKEVKAGELKTITVRMRLPEFAPHRPIPLAVRAYCLDASGRELRFVNAAGRPFSPEISIGKEFSPTTGVTRARPVWRDSLSAFKLDEQILPPMHWSMFRPSYERFQNYASTGIKIFEVPIYPYNIYPNSDYKTPHLKFVDQHIRNLLSVVPDAKILILGDARAGGNWREANPDALMRDAFGNPGRESLASPIYLEAIKKYIRSITEGIEAKPYADHVIGYKFVLGPQPDASLGGVQSNEGVTDRSKWTVGDWNQDALKAFQSFLRKKYDDDVEKLRFAWKNPEIDFDNAGPKLNGLVDIQPEHNLFRDPTKGRMAEDYFEFLSGLIASTYSGVISPIIREVTKGRAWVSSWAGYVVELLRGVHPASVQQNNTYGLAHNNFDSDIDCFAGTTSYGTRSVGDRFTPFQLMSSLTLNGKQTLAEIDYRTFVSGPKIYARQRSAQETTAILRRELGSTLIHGIGTYFADWSQGEGRDGVAYFDDPEILSVISKSRAIYADTLAAKKKPKPVTQIAVIVSPESVWYQDLEYPAAVYNSLVRSVLYEQMAHIGAPYDVLQVNDLRFPKVRNQYKLFVFINAFYLSEPQRAWIEDLKRDDKTLAWFYAPGYVSDVEGLSVSSMENLTGMKLDLIPGRNRPEFQTVEAIHPLLKSVNPGSKIAIDAFGKNTIASEMSPAEIFPNFAIQDSAAVTLGQDSDGRARYAAKKLENWRSVYSTVPNASTTLLRNLAEWAGVHLYTKQGLVVEANDRFLMIHRGGAMPENIDVHLTGPAKVRELYSGRDVSQGSDHFTVMMAGPMTELYELEGNNR